LEEAVFLPSKPCSNQRSNQEKEKKPILPKIWPPRSRAPLLLLGIKPTTGRSPNTRLKLLFTSRAARPSPDRPAAPPERREERAGFPSATLKRKERRENGKE
jgi:hypothetical protein